MKRVFIGLGTIGLFAGLGSFAGAATVTMDGMISDSMCGKSHAGMGEMGKNAKECTRGCIKAGGKYVFVSKGKVYQIDNQDYAGLEEHAGHTVKLTGSMTGSTVHAPARNVGRRGTV